MCLFIGNNRIKKCRKDIVCYKILKVCDSQMTRLDYPKSTIHSHIWKIGKKQDEIKLSVDFYHKAKIINKGYHAYKSLNIAISELIDSRCSIFKAIIPKGSDYCISRKGWGNEIVGSNLIIKKEL